MKNKGKYRRNRNVDFYRYDDTHETIWLLEEKISRFSRSDTFLGKN